jgi:uncharacterized protein (TIGR02145 family)
MAENLDVTKFRNGDPIPEAKTDEEWKKAGENMQPAWCYYNNDTINRTKYGKLYNWYAINDPRCIAPDNFSVPTINEWKIMIEFLGGEDIAGLYIKSTTGWMLDEFNIGGNGTNESRFCGRPGGYREKTGTFIGGSFRPAENTDDGYIASWWSASEKDTNIVYCPQLLYYNPSVFINKTDSYKGCGLSVRFVKSN